MAKKQTSELTIDILPLPYDQLIADYRLAYCSRQAAIMGRREVLTGKAAFGETPVRLHDLLNTCG
jgi:hypothetical protein